MRRARRTPAAQGVRALRAAGVVLAFVLFAVAVDVAAKQAIAVEQPSVATEAAVALSSGGSIESYASKGGDMSTETFERELFSLAGERDVRAANDGATVGFSRDGSAEDAFASVALLLQESGWTCVPSGSPTCASFVKGDGDIRWALVFCAGFGDETSVVVQCA